MSDIVNEIEKELFSLADEKYRDFSASLIPTVDKNNVIGVRTPELRKLAKTLAKDERTAEFLSALPHKYQEENALHGYIISLEKDFDTAVSEIERFLPFIDNWAVCDTTSPKVFANNKPALLEYIKKWLRSDRAYTVRFGVGMLMQHFLDEAFESEQMTLVADIRSEEYYVKMMQAWYFATALAKQYEAAFEIIRDKKLDKWTHNKTIQKAVESYRITDEKKEILKGYRIK
ncbi:MAG: DNA alkylation repair protein [Oscillospiraceae bacterium]